MCLSINVFAICYKQKAESHAWRDKEDCIEAARGEEKSKQDVEAEEEIPLVGQHDQPLNLHQHRRKTVTFQNDMVRLFCVPLNQTLRASTDPSWSI